MVACLKKIKHCENSDIVGNSALQKKCRYEWSGVLKWSDVIAKWKLEVKERLEKETKKKEESLLLLLAFIVVLRPFHPFQRPPRVERRKNCPLLPLPNCCLSSRL